MCSGVPMYYFTVVHNTCKQLITQFNLLVYDFHIVQCIPSLVSKTNIKELIKTIINYKRDGLETRYQIN